MNDYDAALAEWQVIIAEYWQRLDVECAHRGVTFIPHERGAIAAHNYTYEGNHWYWPAFDSSGACLWCLDFFAVDWRPSSRFR